MAHFQMDRMLLLGPMQVFRNGAPLTLPRSRKTRALLAYLAIAPRPVTRDRLCELFWDAADDPRSELRWCLSKLRPLVDTSTTARLVADREQVQIDTSSLEVDALLLLQRVETALTSHSPGDLQALRGLFRGDFLEGLHLDRTPEFEHWLSGSRLRFNQLRQRLLQRLSSVLPPESDDRIEVLQEWIEVAPFDELPHVDLVQTLAHRALYFEAEQQIAASVTRFESEGIDPTPLKAAFAVTRRSMSKATGVSSVDTPHMGGAPREGTPHTRGPTLLVMPFVASTLEEDADAKSITSDVIFGIAKLKSISVIARGTAFLMRRHAPTAAAALVNAQYVGTGYLRRDGGRYLVSVELIEPESGRLLWADEISCNAVASFSVPPQLAAQIAAGLDAVINGIERNRVFLTPPASLDAWQAYHRGLSHLYRFTSDSNRDAQKFFAKAITLDPTFSRSYAGLSFTHFQNAFHLHVADAEREIALAFETAGDALQADASDPAAHCAIGRALWLQHRHDCAVSELNEAVRLSPNYALAHYFLSFAQCSTGDPAHAMDAADIAAHLSPLDPMMFGTLRVRTIALLRLGRVKEAADCASLFGPHAGDHVHAHAVAALTLAAAGRIVEASTARRRVGALRPDYNLKQLREALHLQDDINAIYQSAAKLLDIAER